MFAHSVFIIGIHYIIYVYKIALLSANSECSKVPKMHYFATELLR